MKSSVKNATLLFLGSVTTAFAANGADKGENSLIMFLFLGFGALIIVFQAIPGMLLFFSMLKGLFKPVAKEQVAEKANKAS